MGNLLKIILPLTKPALASLTIITFVNTWNDYMGPFIYLSSTENKTIQLGLKMFVGLFDAEYALIIRISGFYFTSRDCLLAMQNTLLKVLLHLE